GLRRARVRAPGLGTRDVSWVDAHVAGLTDGEAVPPAVAPGGAEADQPGPFGQIVRAPLTGTVISVAAGTGDQVAAGDELLVIEAMKMEHEVRAPTAGLVREVPAAGATVTAGDVLVVLAESGAEAAEQAQAGD